MKKSGKFFSYVLVLALIVSLLSGLGFKAENVSADPITYHVLEIVPDRSMGTFSLLVGDYNNAVSVNDVEILRLKDDGQPENWSSAASFLSTHKIGSVNTTAKTYTSGDYFRQNILKAIDPNAVNWNIDVKTRTPSEVEADINLLKNADLIVINETVPSCFGGITRKTFETSGCTFSKTNVLNIFKKIAGLLDGKAVPYIIDFSLYNLNLDPVSYSFGAGTWRGFLPAKKVATLTKGNDGTGRIEPLTQSTYRGSNLNSYKLLKLLTCIDPATLYGLFFKSNDGSFGFDEDLNQLFVYSSTGADLPTFNLNGKSQEWSEVLCAPWAYDNTIDGTSGYHFASDISATNTKMGWFLASDYAFNQNEIKPKNPYDNFCKIVGSGSGSGVVYNSPNGIFNVLDELSSLYTGSSSGAPETASASDFTASYKFSYSDSDSDDYSGHGVLSLTNNSAKSISLTEITFSSMTAFSSVELDGGTVLFDNSTGDLTFKLSSALIIPAGGTVTYSGTWASATSKNNVFDEEAGTVTGSLAFNVYDGNNGGGNLVLEYDGEEGVRVTNFTFSNVEGFDSFSNNNGFVAFDKDNGTIELTIPYDQAYFDKNNKKKTFYSACVFEDGGAPGSGSGEQTIVVTRKERTEASKTDQTGTNTVSNVKATYYTATSTTDKDDLRNLFRPFVSNSKVVDYHPYKYLVVSKNKVDGTVNRSVVADMVGYANSQGVGLAGGITVDCMSVEQFANISVDLSETYDAICIEGGSSSLVSGSSGATKYSSYPSDRKVSFTTSALLTKFSNDLTNGIGIRYITEPKEYVNTFLATFKSENATADGWDMYHTTGEADLNSNTTYIDGSTKQLNFSLDISGPASSYEVYLYVDVDNNDKFDSYESAYYDSSSSEWKMGSDSSHSLGTATKNVPFTRNVGLQNILGEDFAGGFAWKLVVKGGGKSVSRIGFSAIKVTEDSQKEIRILQVYPTDYGAGYHNDGDDDTGSSANVHSYPLIVLPTKQEINNAKTAHGGKNITEYIPTKGDGLLAVKKYFSGKLKIHTKDAAAERKLFWSTDTKDDTTNDLGDGYRDAILLNSSLLYYYLAKLNTYELDVTKYSVQQFNTKCDSASAVNPEIFYNESTNKFYKMEAGKEVDFDLLILGFGTSMDYMTPEVADKIELYLQQGGSAFVGSGAVTRTANNNLGHKIHDEIGMTETYTSGYTLFDSKADASTMMFTNNTLFTRYPYTANHYLKGSGEHMDAYMLDVSSDDLVCTYAKYNSGSTATAYGTWGYVRQNYYLYKYKNVTYCAFGKNWNAEEIGQDNGVMSPPEAQIIVNALITAARNGSDSTNDDPYLNCDDPDRSVITLEEPEMNPDGSVKPDSATIWKLRDGIYTDYDSFGMAQTALGGTLSFEITSPTGGIILNTNTSSDIRWIPYYYETAVDGGATLIFATDPEGTHKISQIGIQGGTVTDGEFAMGSAGYYTIGVPVNKSSYGSTSNLGFELTSAKTNDQFSFYMLLKRNKDNKIIEQHEVVMVRRVLYPVN